MFAVCAELTALGHVCACVVSIGGHRHSVGGGGGQTRKRHQQDHRPQRPTESSNPTQHAKGTTGECPGPRKETTTRRNVTQGAEMKVFECLRLNRLRPHVADGSVEQAKFSSL